MVTSKLKIHPAPSQLPSSPNLVTSAAEQEVLTMNKANPLWVFRRKQFISLCAVNSSEKENISSIIINLKSVRNNDKGIVFAPFSLPHPPNPSPTRDDKDLQNKTN